MKRVTITYYALSFSCVDESYRSYCLCFPRGIFLLATFDFFSSIHFDISSSSKSFVLPTRWTIRTHSFRRLTVNNSPSSRSHWKAKKDLKFFETFHQAGKEEKFKRKVSTLWLWWKSMKSSERSISVLIILNLQSYLNKLLTPAFEI